MIKVRTASPDRTGRPLGRFRIDFGGNRAMAGNTQPSASTRTVGRRGDASQASCFAHMAFVCLQAIAVGGLPRGCVAPTQIPPECKNYLWGGTAPQGELRESARTVVTFCVDCRLVNRSNVGRVCPTGPVIDTLFSRARASAFPIVHPQGSRRIDRGPSELQE